VEDPLVSVPASPRPRVPASARSPALPLPIAVLPAEVAERIAAGEVIERPTSAVRELLDNSLDAGAREITVEIRGGGLEIVRVSDDGSGIPPDQVELAFQRHATSKIRAVDDLFSLRTLGFRGEALPSMAAVAEVTMLTRDRDSDVGTMVMLRAGEVARRSRMARQPGTTVTVRHLFQNVPARLKFLPASRNESLVAGQLVRRYALAHPDVCFSLMVDGHLSFRSSGSGRLETAIRDVYGPAVGAAMLPLHAEVAGGATVGGYISGRTVTRPGRHHVTLLVNGRWATCPRLAAALESAYRPFLPRGRHPVAVIVLEVPPGELDPNVHPAKTEVRLLREQEVAEALARAVRETLGHTPARPMPTDDFSLSATQIHLPSPRRHLAERPGVGWDPDSTEDEPLSTCLPRLRVLAQLHRSVILAEGARGLFLIDQHRAHERVIYEKLLRRNGEPEPDGQSLLEPVVLELKPHQAAVLEERLPYLEELGFSCQRFGGRDYLVRAVPSLPRREDFVAHLEALLEEAASEDEGWRERLLASIACRAAVRRNRPLDEAEMQELLHELAGTSAPATCPHGSPLVLEFSGSFLERQFGAAFPL
jgi:DNA mismatch repair protein MutL